VARDLILCFDNDVELQAALLQLVMPGPGGDQAAALVICRHGDSHSVVAFHSGLPKADLKARADDVRRMMTVSEARLRRQHRGEREDEPLGIWPNRRDDLSRLIAGGTTAVSSIYRIARDEALADARVRDLDRTATQAWATEQVVGAPRARLCGRDAEVRRDELAARIERQVRERLARMSPRLLGM
jgi:hypothetical protein